MAFHPYPQVIPRLFNVNGFGPPLCVTTASTCPWVDHTVSRLPLLTSGALFRLAFAAAPHLKCLTLPVTATRRLIMQKARRHHAKGAAPTACKRMVSGSISLRYSRFFSPFPHGTGSLSVSQEYLVLADGPAGFIQGFTCPALLRIPLPITHLTRTGLSPYTAQLSRWFRFNNASDIVVLQPPHCRNNMGLDSSTFARRYSQNHYCFLLLRLLRCFSSPGLLHA